MSQHPEIIAGPLTLWVAPVGTSFPLPGAQPAAPWVLVGTNGARSTSRSGVTVAHQHQWTSPPPPAGETAATVAMLESEDLRVRVELLDLTLEQYALALGSNGIAIAPRMPAAPGTRTMGLSIGARNRPELALIARGPSPYVAGLIVQYELPRCIEIGSPQVIYTRATPSGLAFEFRALPDPAATSEAERFGRLIAQDSPAVVPIAHEDGRYLLTSDDLFLEI